VCGFGALLFSGFPGLAQLGLYALTGVLTAALVTRFVLPPLAGDRIQVAVPARAGRALHAGLQRAWLLRWPVAGLALAAAVYLATQHDRLWLPNLSALSTISAEDAARDARLRADLGTSDARYLVVVTAPDREAALQAAERAGRRLDRLAADGVIGGYDSPARFLPSTAAQAARRASLPPPDELQRRLQAALVDSPLSAAKLAPFVADVGAARHAPLLGPHDLAGSSLALAVDSLLLHGAKGWSALLPLRTAGDSGAAMPAAAVRAALAGSGALFVDTQGQFDALYGDYLHEAVWLSSAGFVAIVALLALALRSPRRLAGVLLPLVMAVALVIAALHFAGERLHLLHLVGMLLIVAVGSNYALFFDRITEGEALEAATLMAMAVAATTTVIGFGTLALSSVPVLHAIGVTVGPGALLALLLSAVFAPRQEAA
jgi:predicted exporter